MDSTEEALRRAGKDYRRSQQTQMRLVIAAAGILLALGATGHAQQQIEWKQPVATTPKGLNLPKDVKGDILGIELGDTYAEVKPKLQRLLAESAEPTKPQGSALSKSISESLGETEASPITEKTIQFRINAPGGFITASYVGGFLLVRKMPGTIPVADHVELRLSAPSSGHQVLGIKRTIMYDNPADQPRITELLAQLKEKYKAAVQTVYRQQSISKFRIQFDDGRAFVPQVVNIDSCVAQYGVNGASLVPSINRTGDCDVVLDIDITHGLSNDHIKSVTFVLSDNERTKANVGADFAYFDAYVRDLQSRTKGNAPKL